MTRLYRTIAAVWSLGLLLAACGPQATDTLVVSSPPSVGTEPSAPTEVPTESAPEPVVLRIGMTFEPDNFHPLMMVTGWRFADMIYEGFVGWGLDCEITPRLAESMELSEDGLTWTINLRPGITYNDGQPFNARVLKESWDWLASLDVGQWFPPIRLAESYEAVDDLTFRFTTSEPIGTWSGYDAVWQWPFPPHIWGSLDDESIWTFDNNVNPVGTGPYTLTEWVLGDHLIFDARPDYYLGKPPVDRLIFQMYANWDAEINALLGGEIDISDSYVPAQYLEELGADSKITVVERPPAYYYQLVFNAKEGAKKHPAIDDLMVREAIDYAINRQQLVAVGLMGHGVTCATNWNCGPLFEWSYDPSLTVTPYDPEKAKSLLEEGGYTDSDGDGIRETPDGQPLELRLYYRADRAPEATMSDMINAWLAEVGIATSVEAIEMNTLQATMLEERDFDMAIRFWAADVDPAVLDFFWSCWSAEGGTGNPSGYCNPEVDELIHQQFVAKTLEERLPPLFEAERIVARERPILMLAGENASQAYRNDRFSFPDNACSFWGMNWDWAPLLQAQPVK